MTPEYRALVETASLDWQVAQYIRAIREGSSPCEEGSKAQVIWSIAAAEYGDGAFRLAVANY